MTIDRLQEVHGKRPFEPFTLCLADGDKVHVAHPEFIAFHPTKRTVYVISPEGAGQFIDLLLVTKIDMANGAGKRRRKA